MMEEKLKQLISTALNSLYNIEVEASKIAIEPTKDDFIGDFTFVVFPYLKQSKKGPEQTATDIGNYLQEHLKEMESFNVIKGFLNISLSNSFWINFLQTNYTNVQFGFVENSSTQKIMVEYSSPNTNKPLHLGHVRNNLLGYAVSQILKANGHQVVMCNLVNDRGIHICKSMLAWIKYGNGETPQSSGLKGDHLVGKYYVEFDKQYKKEIGELEVGGLNKEEAEKKAPSIIEAQELLQKWEANDAETVRIWKMMNDWVYAGFDETYKKLGVEFDQFYYESNTYLLGKEIVQEGLSKEVFFKKEDGSVWVDLTDDGLDQKLLLRGDGTSVYITQDIGTAELKYKDFGCERSIYVVGNEQDYHFKVLQLICKKLGKSYANGIYHLSYGMVELPNGKMKSREGTVVDADDLVDGMIKTAEETTITLGKTEGLGVDELSALYQTIGMGALKYFLLKVDPKKKMLFNPEESIDFQGNTGPFIQYTYARIKSILRNSAIKNIFNDDESKNADWNAKKNNISFELDLEKKYGTLPKRLSQEEERGRIEGGRIHVEASIIAEQSIGANEEIQQTQNATNTIFREAQAIEKFAKETGIWKQDYKSELANPDAEGVESHVYLKSDNHTVLKVNSTIQYNGILDFLDSMAVWNYLFPSTNYTIKGFTNKDEKLAVILEQQFIQIDRSANDKEIFDALEGMGFDMQNFTKWKGAYHPKLAIWLRDLHEENVVIDTFGNIQFIDGIIDLNSKQKRIEGNKNIKKTDYNSITNKNTGNKILINRENITFHKLEKELINLLYQYPQTIALAGQELSPGIIANYVYELAKLFNHFYHEHSIIKEENIDQRNLRIMICTQTAHVIHSGFGLLGIQVPERM